MHMQRRYDRGGAEPRRRRGGLSAAEAADLCLRVQAGDCQAEALLVEGHEGLVRSVMRRLALPPTVERDDLVQEGRMALLRAAKKYEAGRGFAFASYAGRAIWQAMKAAVDDEGRHSRPDRCEADDDLDGEGLGRRGGGWALPCLDGLPLTLLERDTLEGRFSEGLSFREIASRQGGRTTAADAVALYRGAMEVVAAAYDIEWEGWGPVMEPEEVKVSDEEVLRALLHFGQEGCKWAAQKYGNAEWWAAVEGRMRELTRSMKRTKGVRDGAA
jgi:DNA-directed RNA polymerase specialized sigma24 family protein